MLEFVILRSKFKGLRVNVNRRFRTVNANTKKAEFTKKHIGSFKLSDDFHYPTSLKADLEPDEVLQLKNWLAEAKFAATFSEEAGSLYKSSLHLPEKLQLACLSLSTEAQKVGMDFIPHQIMLESLLKTAKIVEQKINKLREAPCHILEKAGITSLQVMDDKAYQQHLDIESRSLFKTLLALGQPLPKICTELDKIVRKFGNREARITVMQLKDWAHVLPGRQLKKVNRWAYAAAIELLLHYQQKPLLLAPPERVVQYWLSQHQMHLSLEQARQQFLKLFEPPLSLRDKLMSTIDTLYKTI